MKVRSWHRALGSAGLVVGSVTIALVAAEALARIAWRMTPRTPPPRAAPPSGLPELTNIFELAAPNMRGVARGVLHRTNAVGMRGRDYAVAKPPGTFRVAIGGDSFTMGMGVAEEDIYPTLLETALNAERDDYVYEVLNLGLGGLNAAQVVERLERIGLPFDPDLVVYAFNINDLEGRPPYRKTRRDDVLAEERARVARFARSPSYLLRLVGPRWESLVQRWRARPGSYLHEVTENYLDNPAVWSDFLAQLDRFAAIGKARDACVHVFILTDLHHLNFLHPFRRFYDRVARAAEERGLTVTQSFPALRGYDGRALHVGAFDAHPNAEAHRLLARALLDGLRKLPARCWEARSRHPATAGVVAAGARHAGSERPTSGPSRP
jgi:lysophospholipase L1-like esterase